MRNRNAQQSIKIEEKTRDWYTVIAVFVLVLAVIYIALWPALPQNYVTSALLSLSFIALGLSIPYWIFKIAIYAANRSSAERKERVFLEDLPKDQEELKPRQKPKKRGHH